MNVDGLFKSMIGIDIGMMRTLTAAAGLCTIVLLVFRFRVVLECMRRPLSDFVTPIDRLIWVGLAALIPLGVGAYAFHLVVTRRPFQWFFIIPFATIVASAGYMFFKVWPMSSKFSFDFLGI